MKTTKKSKDISWKSLFGALEIDQSAEDFVADLEKERKFSHKINPSLQGKYDDQPLFQDKVNRANHILKTVGIPKF
jgi:hypothetical protein